ncbi:hypothetical protein [Erythrobacter sp. EC-HK427]|uniref:hypothetical protein n=1 Tax=Erythrobacter sp. EC-HK427 TaxID=2038396 RepID=UPI0012546E6F|nr:hypothetical protein [Erythrobacter sp. EC-HK427]VVT12736.1 hypothetical protein ERY430_60351 [Erythrobacter sp. EC-HK427]
MTLLESESNGWRDLGYVVKADPETHYHGVIALNGHRYRMRETERRIDWSAPFEGQLLFDRLDGWSDDAGSDVRDFLAEQGFSGPLNGREQIYEAGVVQAGTDAYNIYTFRGVHQPVPGGVDHGVNKILVLRNGNEFLGQYSVSMPSACQVSGRLVECSTGSPPSTFEFTADGPPAEIWFDGEAVPFERAN